MTHSDARLASQALHEIAAHAHNLSESLQNVAPPKATTGTSIDYLREISIELEKASRKMAALAAEQQK